MAGSDLTISGLASGVNTADIVSKLMSLESMPLVQMQTQQKALEAQKSTWREFNTRLQAVSGTLDTLKLSATFAGKKADVSDASVLSVSAATNTPTASYTIQVKQLASSDSVVSNSIVDFSASATLTSQLPGFQAGKISVGGTVVEVTDADTLNSLVEKVNKAQTNVQASVINNRLVLTSAETGVDNALKVGVTGGSFEVSDGDDDVGTQDSNVLKTLGIYTDEYAQNNPNNPFSNYLVQAADADAYINGIEVTGSSNTLTEAVTGLTITLKAVSESIGSTGNPLLDLKGTSVQVSGDTQKTVTAVQAFITQYNALMSFIDNNTGYDSTTKVAGALFGDSSVRTIQQSLRRIIGSSVDGLDPAYNSLAQIGVSTTSKNATLTLDQDKLTDALIADPTAVAILFGANRTDLALNSNGGTASASSELANYSAASAIIGNAGYEGWGTNGGWQSDTSGLSVLSPAYLDIDFGAEKSVNELLINTINSAALPANLFGIMDFDIQYWDSAQWTTVKSITGNTSALVNATFNTVVTQKIRINVTAANGANDAARIVNVNAYSPNMGVATRLSSLLNSYTDYGTGVIDGRTKSLDAQIKDIKNRMTNLSVRLDLREETLRNQFTAMEQAIQSLKSQGNSLTNMLNSLPLPLSSISR